MLCCIGVARKLLIVLGKWALTNQYIAVDSGSGSGCSSI